jgi:hypothetical protein
VANKINPGDLYSTDWIEIVPFPVIWNYLLALHNYLFKGARKKMCETNAITLNIWTYMDITIDFKLMKGYTLYER